MERGICAEKGRARDMAVERRRRGRVAERGKGRIVVVCGFGLA